MKRLSALVLALLMTISLAACGNALPEEMLTAIEDGSFESEMIEENEWEILLDTTQAQKEIAAILTEYQTNDEVAKALDLIYELSIDYDDEAYINGKFVYASETFIDWLKNAVLDEDAGTADYEFAWNEDSIINQIGYCEVGDTVPVSILAKNDSYDVDDTLTVKVGDDTVEVEEVTESYNEDEEPWEANDYEPSYNSSYSYGGESNSDDGGKCSICGGSLVCNYCGASGLYCYNASFGSGQRHYCSTHWADIAEDSVYDEEADIYYDYDLYDPESGYDYQFDYYDDDYYDDDYYDDDYYYGDDYYYY